MASTEEDAYPIMQSLDVDYVLVIFGGMTGYSSDDINKFLWMVRIGGGVFPHIKVRTRVSSLQLQSCYLLRACGWGWLAGLNLSLLPRCVWRRCCPWVARGVTGAGLLWRWAVPYGRPWVAHHAQLHDVQDVLLPVRGQGTVHSSA
jgi:hypothetical protein